VSPYWHMLERLQASENRNELLKKQRIWMHQKPFFLCRFLKWALRSLYGQVLTWSGSGMGKCGGNLELIYLWRWKSLQVVYCFICLKKHTKGKWSVPWLVSCSDAGCYTNEGGFYKQRYASELRSLRVLGKSLVTSKSYLALKVYETVCLTRRNLKLKTGS